MQLLLLILIPAIGFGGWPVAARLAGTTAAWTNAILMSVTTILVLGYYGKTLMAEPITGNQAFAMSLVALMNFAGLVAFAIVIQKYPQYVVIAQALMPVVSFVGTWKLIGVPVSAGQVVCLAIACLGIAGMGYFTPPQPTP